jgi:hypothetical protein
MRNLLYWRAQREIAPSPHRYRAARRPAQRRVALSSKSSALFPIGQVMVRTRAALTLQMNPYRRSLAGIPAYIPGETNLIRAEAHLRMGNLPAASAGDQRSAHPR